jgi:hypothetical protein
MAWLTRKSPLAGLAQDVPNAVPEDVDGDSVTDWSSDDPTGSIMVVHERLASASPASSPLPSGPVLEGALSATDAEKLDGLMQQMRYDLSRGHHREASQLLAERLKASRIELTDEQRDALVADLQAVDFARHAREKRDADADSAATGTTEGQAS